MQVFPMQYASCWSQQKRSSLNGPSDFVYVPLGKINIKYLAKASYQKVYLIFPPISKCWTNSFRATFSSRIWRSSVQAAAILDNLFRDVIFGNFSQGGAVYVNFLAFHRLATRTIASSRPHRWKITFWGAFFLTFWLKFQKLELFRILQDDPTKNICCFSNSWKYFLSIRNCRLTALVMVWLPSAYHDSFQLVSVPLSQPKYLNLQD